MKFHTFLDARQTYKQFGVTPMASLPLEEFYGIHDNLAHQLHDPFMFRQGALELAWNQNSRPYYNVWPAITPMMLKLKLSVPCNVIKLHTNPLLLRLPEDDKLNALSWDKGRIRNILFGVQEVCKHKGATELVQGMVIMMDTGETNTDGSPIHTFKIFPLRDDLTLDECINSLEIHVSWATGEKMPPEVMENAIRLCCCVCLIGDDPELVTPDVLANDRSKYAEAKTEQQRQVIVDRARRRGKLGFDLGHLIECIPHVRRPHLALVWYGKGRTESKIVLRAGSIVHRTKITTVPTGKDSK